MPHQPEPIRQSSGDQQQASAQENRRKYGYSLIEISVEKDR
jgi:hypothetical protein